MAEYQSNADQVSNAVAFTMHDGIKLTWGVAHNNGTIWMQGYPMESPPSPVIMYKMRGMDAVVLGLYDSWLSEQEPDLDASKYAGSLNLPLRDVIVVDSWPL